MEMCDYRMYVRRIYHYTQSAVQSMTEVVYPDEKTFNYFHACMAANVRGFVFAVRYQLTDIALKDDDIDPDRFTEICTALRDAKCRSEQAINAVTWDTVNADEYDGEDEL